MSSERTQLQTESSFTSYSLALWEGSPSDSAHSAMFPITAANWARRWVASDKTSIDCEWLAPSSPGLFWDATRGTYLVLSHCEVTHAAAMQKREGLTTYSTNNKPDDRPNVLFLVWSFYSFCFSRTRRHTSVRLQLFLWRKSIKISNQGFDPGQRWGPK